MAENTSKKCGTQEPREDYIYIQTEVGRNTNVYSGNCPVQINNLSNNAQIVIQLGTGRQNRLHGSNDGKRMRAFATVFSESDGSSSQD
jgi:hypothetical protein